MTAKGEIGHRVAVGVREGGSARTGKTKHSKKDAGVQRDKLSDVTEHVEAVK